MDRHDRWRRRDERGESAHQGQGKHRRHDIRLIPVENEATAPWRTQGGMTRDERRGLQVVGRQMAVVRGGAQPTLPNEIGDLRQVVV